MADFTENINLEMPYQDEYYNIEVQNENMKKIDTAIKNIADELNNNEDINNIKQNTESIKNDTNSIRSTVNTINSNTNTIKTNTETLKSDTSNIKSNISSLTSTINTINTNVNTIKTNTETLKSDTSNIKSNLTTTKNNTDTIVTNTNTIKSNVSSILSNTNNINSNTNKIGNTNDSSGSSTSGSIMAKLNKVISDLSSTRLSKIDNIGNTNDSSSSGTTSGGTVMAKLNKLLYDWTSTRASRIDSIYNYTQSSSSSSSSGTLSQKLNYIIEKVNSIDKVGKTLNLIQRYNPSSSTEERIIVNITGDGVVQTLSFNSNKNSIYNMRVNWIPVIEIDGVKITELINASAIVNKAIINSYSLPIIPTKRIATNAPNFYDDFGYMLTPSVQSEGFTVGGDNSTPIFFKKSLKISIKCKQDMYSSDFIDYKILISYK